MTDIFVHNSQGGPQSKKDAILTIDDEPSQRGRRFATPSPQNRRHGGGLKFQLSAILRSASPNLDRLNPFNFDRVAIRQKWLIGHLSAQLNLEDVARGLGFTRIADSGNEVVRWERVEKYLTELGVPTCGHDAFIPENIFATSCDGYNYHECCPYPHKWGYRRLKLVFSRLGG